jgi:hypothetical protein
MLDKKMTEAGLGSGVRGIIVAPDAARFTGIL